MWPHFNSFDDNGVRTTFGEPEEHVTDRGIHFLHWLMTRYIRMQYSSATHQFLLQGLAAPAAPAAHVPLCQSMLVHIQAQTAATTSLLQLDHMSL